MKIETWNSGSVPTLKNIERIPITPRYHYIGDIKSYEDMVKMLGEYFEFVVTKNRPLGFHKSINIASLHILKKKT